MLPVPAPSATGLAPGTLLSVQPVSASGSGAARPPLRRASTGGISGALEAKRQVRVQPSSASAPQAVAAYAATTSGRARRRRVR